MKKLIYSFLLLAFLLSASSCSTKQQGIGKLEKFSTEIEANSKHYSLKDWKEAGERFNKINEKLGKYDYTLKEKKDIAMTELKIVNAIKEGLKESLPNILFDTIADWDSFYEELKSTLGF